MSKYTTYRNLPCELTDEETAVYSMELAQITSRQAEIEGEKKEVLSDFTAKLNKCLADARVLARKITTRKEDRSIECEQEFDYSKGMVYTVRTDTGVTIDQRKLRDDERQERLDFEKKEDERLEKEDAASAEPPNEGIKQEKVKCGNQSCKKFNETLPDNCSSPTTTAYAEPVTGCSDFQPHITETQNVIPDDCADCAACRSARSGCDKCCEACTEPCNLRQICRAKLHEDEAEITAEQIEERDNICVEWRECEFREKCFAPENAEDGICFKDSQPTLVEDTPVFPREGAVGLKLGEVACRVCNQIGSTRLIFVHLKAEHDMTPKDYQKLLGLPKQHFQAEFKAAFDYEASLQEAN